MKSRISRILDPEHIGLLERDLASQIQHHPGWADMWHLRGLLRAYSGDLEAARRAFQEALERNEAYAAARWSLDWTDLLLRRGDGGRAARTDARTTIVRNLLHGVPPDPSGEHPDAAIVFALLAVAAAQGDEDGVLRMSAVLHARDPGLVPLLEVAEFSQDGIPSRCLAELGRPEMLNAGFADLFQRAARLQSISGDQEEATRLFAASALIRGNRANFALDRAELFTRSGDPESALTLCREAVELDPDWYAPHVALAHQLALRGEREEALHHVEAARKLVPQYADVHYHHGLLLESCGRVEEAMEALRRAIGINPGYHVARAALANVLFETEQPGEALPHYEVLLEEGLESAFLRGRLGYAAHAAGQRNRAEELFLEAIAQDRNRPDLLCLYGMFLSETERLVEARAVWDRALDADPHAALRDRILSLRDAKHH